VSVPILQPLNYKRAIVDGQGRPTPEFQQKWRRLYEIAGAIPDVTTAAAMSALLDLIASGEGTILRRGPETWAGLPTPGGTGKFLRADGSYAEPDVTVDEADIDLSDVLTNNVSSTRHGFAPKLPNDATKYLDGTGAYSVPAGGGGGGGPVTIVQAKSVSVLSGVPSVTLDSSPTPGNLLVFIGARWTISINLASGWQQLFSKSATNSLSSIIAAKLVGAADGATQQPYTTNTGWAGVLVEVSGAALSTITAYGGTVDESGTTLAQGIVAPGGDCLSIGAFTSAGKTNTSIGLDGADDLGAFASDTGSSNGGPHSAQGFALTSTGKGAETVTGTYSAAGNYNQFTFATFAPSPF